VKLAPLAGAALVVPPNENPPEAPFSFVPAAVPAGAGVLPKEKPPVPEGLLLLPKAKLMAAVDRWFY